MKPATKVKKVANFARDETLEILKEAKRQVTSSTPEQDKGPSAQPVGPTEEEKIKLEIRRKRQIEALENEMKDIRKKKEEEDRERNKILDQEMANKNSTDSATSDLLEPSTKPKRGIFRGMRGKIERMKRKTEMRLPPSG